MKRSELVIGREYYIQPHERTYASRVLARYCGEKSQPHRGGDTVLSFQLIKTDGSEVEDATGVRGSVLLHSARWVTADRSTYEREQAECKRREAIRKANAAVERSRAADCADTLTRVLGLPFKAANHIPGMVSRVTLDLTPEVLARLLGE